MSRNFVGRPMEILLVEDDLEDARTTIQALSQGNVRCRVSVVRDGEEAMKFLHREGVLASAPCPDLILLDIQLPKKDGHQVLAEIRADDHLKGIPVFVLTTSLVHQVIFQAENLAIDGYMTKPVDVEQFVRTVKSLRRSWLTELVLPP
jgi:two-component system, chemotaxis family, response regulator Rcp1